MAVNVVQNALSSRRVSRLLPWIAGAVLAAGVIAFLVAYFGNTADTSATKDTFGPGKAQTFNAQRQVKLEPAARIVAGKFISTAVARRNLAQAWPLATANVRGGLTYKEWLSGDIRVPALGVPIATAAITKIVYSHPKDAELNIVVLPKPNAYGIKATLYVVDLKKVGSRWLVDYCQVQSTPGAPTPS